MKSIKAILLVSCSIFFIASNAQIVAELRYKNVFTKKKKSDDFAFIKYGQDFVKTQTLPLYNPSKYIDTKNKVVVMDYELNRDFMVEELDSVYRINCDIEKTGEKKVINGYNCEEYSVLKKETFSVTYANSTPIPSVTPTSRTASYDIRFWVTNDLAVDETYSINVSHALTAGIAAFPYKGVIVKITYAGAESYIGLDSVITSKELPKDFTRPWIKNEKPVALLPGDGERFLFQRYTSESLANQFKRMKALLIKITGIEKPKFKTGPLPVVQY